MSSRTKSAGIHLAAALALTLITGFSLAASKAAQPTPADASGVVQYVATDPGAPSGLRNTPPPAAATAGSEAVHAAGHSHALVPPNADPEKRNHLPLRPTTGPKVDSGHYILTPLAK